MTSRIKKLPRGVVDRIAAGEVVERPASVVKELIENSLDAGATRVDVEIAGGGAERIVVKDDGVGMGAEDLALAFESHATSKLSDVADLDHVASFGFRGEALASTGAIADCRILSRERGAADGHEVECRGGEATSVRAAAAPTGTIVDVRQLFKYVPARRKFLRAASTEGGHVASAVQAAALANADVAFSLTRDGADVFRVGKSDDRRARIAAFFGKRLADTLLVASGSDGSASVEGFVARPDAAKSSAAWHHLFLNGRPIRDRTLQHAVRHAYEGLLTRDQFPVVFLFLSMDPAEVDVNVHPAKLEVRFRESDRVHRLVGRAVRDALLAANLSPTVALKELAPQTAATRLEDVRDALAGFLASAPPTESVHRASPPASVALPAVRYLQVRDTFLVFETADGIVVVDQHALHERVLLEDWKLRIAAGTLEVQRMLVPAIVEMPSADADLLLAEADALASAGVAVERFGPTSVAVQSLPTLLGRRDPSRVLAGVVERLRDGGKPGGKSALLDTLLNSMACRAAIMAGDRITETQATELMRRADLVDTRQGCAHGRPTALSIPFSDLERRFRR